MLSHDDTAARARITFDLLVQAEPSVNNRCLNLASRIAFPLERLEEVQDTPRFRASFAIEVLLKAMISREGRDQIWNRYLYALTTTLDWVNSFQSNEAKAA